MRDEKQSTTDDDFIPHPSSLIPAYHSALSLLLAQRREGHWAGELAGSPVATAFAVAALAVADQDSPDHIHRGLDWLVQHQNAGGGWGDTPFGSSNLRAGMICRAAFTLTQSTEVYAVHVERLEEYLNSHCVGDATRRAEAVRHDAAEDSTIAVPVLAMCALAGLVSWDEVPPLPFELACLPPSWLRLARLPAASYAMPALVAIGCAKYFHCRPWNPLTRSVRYAALHGSLRLLESMQPSSGGFLESTPLTSLITLCLASSGCGDHVVTRRGVEFLRRSVRADGSWSADVNLATRVTALSCSALDSAGELSALPGRHAIERWLVEQQFHEFNPYTGAEAGGWSWTDLPGTIPDVEDTAAVLLALRTLHESASEGQAYRGQKSEVRSQKSEDTALHLTSDLGSLTSGTGGLRPPLAPALCYSVALGLQWLLSVQNRDGGWPALCRGHGRLIIERSAPEVTAQALRAIMAWFGELPDIVALASRFFADKRPATSIDSGCLDPLNVLSVRDRGLDYLTQSQRADGSWLPLWFGDGEANPTFGMARVLAAYRDLDKMDSEPARRAVDWLLGVQQPDGSWGGIEATALVVDAFSREPSASAEFSLAGGSRLNEAMNSALTWLVQQVEGGALHHPRPIAYSYDKLGYVEKLYPILFAVSALGKARHLPQHAVS
jgi:squalene-hopene/tetraprenyl-beta-curcumene cyclase